MNELDEMRAGPNARGWGVCVCVANLVAMHDLIDRPAQHEFGASPPSNARLPVCQGRFQEGLCRGRGIRRHRDSRTLVRENRPCGLLWTCAHNPPQNE